MLKLFKEFVPHKQIACNMAEYDPAIHKAIYKVDYPAMFKAFQTMKDNDIRAARREVIMKDRFFIAYFVAGWEDGKSSGNRPFIVNMCKEIEKYDSGTVNIFSREHGKSACITIAGTVQRVCNDPECSTVIFSFRKSSAEKFLLSIKNIFESDFMVWCFPDIFYKNPASESPKWSVQDGIRVKRQNQIKREHTVEAFGLVEGSPIGGHFDHRIYDDIETESMARNPEQLDQCYESLMMSRALGREGGTEIIIGTYYSHCGVLVKLGEKKDIHGNNMYKLLIKPATDDGTITGNPVFFTQEYLDDKKTDSGFNTQYLCNPTPTIDQKLKYDHFKIIPREELPPRRVKFVIIDPAGDKAVLQGNKSDSWAMLTVSIEPDKDDLGLSNVYVEDAIVEVLSLNTAISAACSLFRRAGRVSLLAVEQVGQSTHYAHIKQSLEQDFGVYLELKKKGKYGGNLLLLTPGGLARNYRIESALTWPMCNGKIHLVDDLSILGQLRTECDKFPFFHVDILDALAYLYDILADKTTPMIACGYREKVKSVTEHMESLSFQGVW